MGAGLLKLTLSSSARRSPAREQGEHMKQIWITAAGAPETLQVREAPDPNAGPGQLRIRVAFTGVNFADIQARLGQYPDAPKIPCVVGYEVAGTIDQIR